MDPSADAFIPGQEYEIPHNWGQGQNQQPSVKTTPMVSASSTVDYLHPPPVIHRFQKPVTKSATHSRLQDSSLGIKNETSTTSSLLDVEPEVWPSSLGSMHPFSEGVVVENSAFQTINRTRQTKTGSSSPSKPTQMTKSMKDMRLDENASYGSGKTFGQRSFTGCSDLDFTIFHIF